MDTGAIGIVEAIVSLDYTRLSTPRLLALSGEILAALNYAREAIIGAEALKDVYREAGAEAFADAIKEVDDFLVRVRWCTDQLEAYARDVAAHMVKVAESL